MPLSWQDSQRTAAAVGGVNTARTFVPRRVGEGGSMWGEEVRPLKSRCGVGHIVLEALPLTSSGTPNW